MDLFDLALRGAAIGVIALSALTLALRPDTRRHAATVAAVALAVTGYLICHAPALTLSDGARTLADLATMLTAPALAWLVLDIFCDRPERPRTILVLAGLTIVAAFSALPFPVMHVACKALSIALFLSLLILALSDAADDLVDSRRRMRPVFVIGASSLGAVLTAVELVPPADPGAPLILLAQSVGILAVATGFAIWVLNPAEDIWPAHAPRSPGAVAPGRSGPDAVLIARLQAAMRDGAWRQEGLTIGALAGTVGVPEHRLRQTINRDLGHRNFSAFVNGYRIEAAKQALADPETARVTILEIAYDSGFASLGPFNRAFRAETGQSPSDYRRAALTEAPAPA